MSTPSTIKTGDRSYLRRRNCATVLEHLWSTPSTVSAVARATSLSRTAAEAVIGDLIATGWVVEANERGGEAVPGRPAAIYHVASGIGRIAGIDIGAHHVSVRIATLVGEDLVTVRESADEQLTANERIELAVQLLLTALRRARVSTDELWIITVASPGVVENGRVVHFGGQGMPGWIGLDIRDELERRIDAPAYVEGDSALGAVAEVSPQEDRSDFVYLLSGVRTGAAVVIDGALHRGRRGGAGLVGELPQLRWRELEIEAYGGSEYTDGRPGRAEIFEQAAKGDSAAQRAVDDFADALALGAAAMVLAIDPQAVIIGGPNAGAASLFVERFSRKIASLTPLPPEVVVSELGGDAVLIGAVRYGTEAILAAIRASVELQPAFPFANRSILARTLH